MSKESKLCPQCLPIADDLIKLNQKLEQTNNLLDFAVLLLSRTYLSNESVLITQDLKKEMLGAMTVKLLTGLARLSGITDPLNNTEKMTDFIYEKDIETMKNTADIESLDKFLYLKGENND